jgi:hypothetical protein
VRLVAGCQDDGVGAAGDRPAGALPGCVDHLGAEEASGEVLADDYVVGQGRRVGRKRAGLIAALANVNAVVGSSC